ncbi:MAG TPA: hypothetical protein C5S51_02880 [Methanosarcinaceae archaeon]|nr:hypothetical protein [Methanosarcinaceae archaeon]
MNRNEQIVLAIAFLIPFTIVAYSFYIGMLLWGIILALPIIFVLILLINPIKLSFEDKTETKEVDAEITTDSESMNK